MWCSLTDQWPLYPLAMDNIISIMHKGGGITLLVHAFVGKRVLWLFL